MAWRNFYPTVSADSDDGLALARGPDESMFRHPLQAELHEIKIYSRYRNDGEILTSSAEGIENVYSASQDGLMFYVPPFFVKDTRSREIFQTPFQTVYGSTDDPFNVPLSFGVGGHYLNLENFTKELVKKQWAPPVRIVGKYDRHRLRLAKLQLFLVLNRQCA